MEFAHHLQLGFQFRDETLRERNGPIFVAFAVHCLEKLHNALL
jgi:hypothetical protein